METTDKMAEASRAYFKIRPRFEAMGRSYEQSKADAFRWVEGNLQISEAQLGLFWEDQMAEAHYSFLSEDLDAA